MSRARTQQLAVAPVSLHSAASHLLQLLLAADVLEQEVQHELQRLRVGLPEHRGAPLRAGLLLGGRDGEAQLSQGGKEGDLIVQRRLGLLGSRGPRHLGPDSQRGARWLLRGIAGGRRPFVDISMF